MSRRTSPEVDPLTEEVRGLKLQIGELEVKIETLTRQRADLTQVTDLEREIETLKLQQARLVAENEMKIKDTEHKVGLVQKKQEQDAAHQTRQIELARKEAVLEVREQNLDHSKTEFEERMAFREQQFDRQVTQWEAHLADWRGVLGDVIQRVPNIDVALAGAIGRAPADGEGDKSSSRRSSRTRKDEED